MKPITRTAAAMLATAALLFAATLSTFAAGTGALGRAEAFAVLGGTGVTCTNSRVARGSVGSKTTITKTPTCSIAGSQHQGDATAINAFTDFHNEYLILQGKTCGTNLDGNLQLGGKTLAPGVYCFSSTVTALLTLGNLTLAGPTTGVWIFQIGRDLTTGGNAQVKMANGGQGCNVYWVVGTKATVGTGSKIQGSILAGTEVEFSGLNSSLVGRALAHSAVTMTGTHIELPTNAHSATCHQTP